jgi:dTDP-4-amino-4,6-dideoxygalactose transaminase
MNSQVSDQDKIEQFLSSYLDKKFVLFTRNATTALYLTLIEKLPPGSTVILPVNICFVVTAAVIGSGHQLLFVDIDGESSVDVNALNKIEVSGDVAVIVPHNYGRVADINAIQNLCVDRDWLLVEDVAQAFGASLKGRNAGAFSDYSVVSFGQGKILDVGFGGALCTNNEALYLAAKKRFATLTPHSESVWQEYLDFNDYYLKGLNKSLQKPINGLGERLCHNYFKGNIHGFGDRDNAKVADVLEAIEDRANPLTTRQKNHELFKKYLIHPDIKVIEHKTGDTYWRQNVLAKNRDELLAFLRTHGIKVSTYYPPIHKFFKNTCNEDFPVAQKFNEQVINFWPGYHTTEEEIIKINSLVHEFYDSKN